MALPVIAAAATGAARVVAGAATGAARGATAVSGRAVAGAGRAVGTTARAGGRASRPVSQIKSQFRQARMDAQRFRSVNDDIKRSRAQQPDEEEGEETQQFQAAQEQMQAVAGSQTSRLKQAVAMARLFNSLKAASPEEAKKTQDVAKAAVKQLIPKVALMIANFVAGALELGTGGLAVIVTFFVRFIQLAWYNTEMIYGGFIMKGRHKLVGPLTWAPIPMPFEKKGRSDNALGPMMVVILIDLAFMAALMMPIVLIGTIFAIIF